MSDAVMSGQAWRDFCNELADIGDMILAEGAPDSPLERAEGYRYLTRLLKMGVEQHIEARDTSFPFFYKLSHATAKIGADNPDNVYWNAKINGDWDYRIRLKRGTMAYFSIVANAFRYHIDGTLAATGALEDADIAWDKDGYAEIVASKHRQDGNWLKLESDASLIVLRQSYLDRENETPGEFTIERIGGPEKPAPLDPQEFADGLAESAAFVRGIVGTFVEWSELFKQNPNSFPEIDQQMFQRAGGGSDLHYVFSYWKLAADEAWVIEVTPPDCYYWNFQLNNWWMESLDYRFLQITVNKHTAQHDPDGSIKIIVSARDPGFGNWIDTAGHEQGTALLRWAGASEYPLPKAKVVKLAELEG